MPGVTASRGPAWILRDHICPERFRLYYGVFDANRLFSVFHDNLVVSDVSPLLKHGRVVPRLFRNRRGTHEIERVVRNDRGLELGFTRSLGEERSSTNPRNVGINEMPVDASDFPRCVFDNRTSRLPLHLVQIAPHDESA